MTSDSEPSQGNPTPVNATDIPHRRIYAAILMKSVTSFRISERLSPGYRHVQKSFSQAVMRAHAITLGVELRHPDEALQAVELFDPAWTPSLARRSRHLIGVARGHYQWGEQHAA